MDGQMLMQVQEMLMHLKKTSFMFQILLVQKCVQKWVRTLSVDFIGCKSSGRPAGEHWIPIAAWQNNRKSEERAELGWVYLKRCKNWVVLWSTPIVFNCECVPDWHNWLNMSATSWAPTPQFETKQFCFLLTCRLSDFFWKKSSGGDDFVIEWLVLLGRGFWM